MPQSKYNVDKSEKGKKKREYKGIEYASELEMKYFRFVVEPQLDNGTIIKCERQVKYELSPSFTYKGKKYQAIHYVSDFNLTFSDGSEKVIDIKGLAKPIDIIKRKLLLLRYPNINFMWVGYSQKDGGWLDYEEIKKARATRKRKAISE